MIHRERRTATLDGGFVVFLIGMRVNQPLKVHRWLPVATAMSRMLGELYRQPDLGLLHAESWFSRTILVLQYWRSMDQLMAYARNRQAAHLPAWQAFNRASKGNAAVGIWHETYEAAPGTYENIYVNMPPFGLSKPGRVLPADGNRQSAPERLRARGPAS